MYRGWIMLLVFLTECSGPTDPVLQRAWDQHLQRAWNWAQADVEACKYKAEEAEAAQQLQLLRGMYSPFLASAYLRMQGFHCRSEYVDFVSYPWVTLARRRGDCEDYQVLWEEIVSAWGGYSARGLTQNYNGKNHAFLVWYETDTKFYLFSNYALYGWGDKGKEDALVRSMYGDETYGWFWY